jgi:hypothetical protein
MKPYRMPGGEFATAEADHCFKCWQAVAWSLSRPGSVTVSRLLFCPNCGEDLRMPAERAFNESSAADARRIYQNRTANIGVLAKAQTTPLIDDQLPCSLVGHRRVDVTRVDDDRVRIYCQQCDREWYERKLTLDDFARVRPVPKG